MKRRWGRRGERIGEAGNPGPPRRGAPSVDEYATRRKILEQELELTTKLEERAIEHGRPQEERDRLRSMVIGLTALVEHAKVLAPNVDGDDDPTPWFCTHCATELNNAQQGWGHVFRVHLLGSLKQDPRAQESPLLAGLAEKGAALCTALLAEDGRTMFDLLKAAGIKDTEIGTNADFKRALDTLCGQTSASARMDAAFRALAAVVQVRARLS